MNSKIKINSDNLNETLDDLNKHKRSKEELIVYYINKRLSQSLKIYYTDLNNTFKYLDDKDMMRLAKKLKKE